MNFLCFLIMKLNIQIKNYSDINVQTRKIYHSLNNGTLILDGIPITIDNVSEEQIEYMNTIAELYKEKYKEIKEKYKPRFVKYAFGNSVVNIVGNTTTIEVPDPRHFKEWSYIKGFEYLQNFLNEYKKQNNKGIEITKKLISFFKK